MSVFHTASDLHPADLLAGLPEHNRLWLALSGGLDSVVLLDLTARYCAEQGWPLQVLHVHHGLSANADHWAGHCRQLCRDYALQLKMTIDCQVVRVTPDQGASLELQARQARYRVFEQHLESGDLLLMAHHGDDQLETLLLRLMRGSGSAGLAGIPVQRPLGAGHLYRPLLSVSRADLEAYARARKLHWVEDESNSCQDFDRNFLRHQITPLLKQRWPQAVQVAGRSAALLADSEALNRQLAQQDLDRVSLSAQALSCRQLTQLPRPRRYNVLRLWLQQAGLDAPEQRHLAVICRELIGAQADARPEFRRPGFCLRRYRDQLILQLAENTNVSGGADSVPPTARDTLALPLTAPATLDCAGVAFRLWLSSAGGNTGEPISLPGSGQLQLRARVGGERLCLPARGHRPVKKLLQEAGIPPWLRTRVRLFWWLADDGGERLLGMWAPENAEQTGVAEHPVYHGRFWWHPDLLCGPDPVYIAWA